MREQCEQYECLKMDEKEIVILCSLIAIFFEILFEDEDSPSNTELLENIFIILNKHRIKNPILRLKGYVEDILPSYTDIQFKSHFR